MSEFTMSSEPLPTTPTAERILREARLSPTEVHLELDAPDAPDEWVVYNGMGGYICSVCGDPVESEPCPEHQPDAYARCIGTDRRIRHEEESHAD